MTPSTQSQDVTSFAPMPPENPRGARNSLLDEDPTSKNLGLAALICAVIPTPLTLLAAVVMGWMVLSRGRVRAGRGRANAVAALIVAGTLVSLALALVTAAVIFGRGEDPAGTHLVSATQLQVGDCIGMPTGTSVVHVRVVPCDKGHDAEVFDQFDLPAGDYPGDTMIAQLSEEGCLARLDAFTGSPVPTGRITVNFFMPLREKWPAATVTCLIGSKGSQTTGTLRGGATSPALRSSPPDTGARWGIPV